MGLGRLTGALGALVVGVTVGCGPAMDTDGSDDTEAPRDTDVDSDTGDRPTVDDRLQDTLAALEPPVAPLEALPAPEAERVELGRLLFFDPVLSGNKDIACATCHDPAHGTSDGLPLTLGTGAVGRGPARAEGEHPPWGRRRAPPLWGRARLDALFWDGRVEVTGDGVSAVVPLPEGAALSPLATQALHPILDPKEMLGRPGDLAVDGTTNELAAQDAAADTYRAIEARLDAIDGYRQRLQALDADWSMVTVVEALTAYQQARFDVVETRWDRYLRGEADALTDEEKLGATFFFADERCVSCHAGPTLSDGRFHNIGVRPLGQPDPGREGVTGDPAQRFAMRTPPLRNVAAVEGPYFHNGAVADLEGIVVHYSDPEARRAPTDHLPDDLEPSTDPEVDAALDSTLSSDLPLIGGGLTTAGLSNIRVFLGALTDEGAVERAIEDVPESVPSGLAVGGWER